MNSYSTSPLESAPDSSASLEMDDYCQIKLQKDNGKSINFAFLPSYTVKEIDWGVRSALNIPKSATYSISFKDNGEDVHMAPNGGMLKECVVLKKIVKLDVNVRPTTPQLQPQPQSLSTSSSANKGDDAQRWPWPALLERFDRRNNRLTTHSDNPTDQSIADSRHCLLDTTSSWPPRFHALADRISSWMSNGHKTSISIRPKTD